MESDLLPTTFLDSTGDKWNVPVLTYGVIRRVANDTGVVLTDIYAPTSESFKKIVEDSFAMGNVLLSLLSGEIRKRGIDEDAFLDRFENEKVASEAFTCVENAVLNYFPPAKKKTLLIIREKYEAMEKEQVDQATEKVEAADLRKFAG